MRGLFSGKVGMFGKTRQLIHPEYMILRGDDLDAHEADDFAGALIPVYPATKDVRTWTISNAVRHRAEHARPAARPGSGQGACPARPARLRHRDPRDPPTRRSRRVVRRPAPAEVGRGARRATRARAAPRGRGCRPGDGAPAARRRHARRVRRRAAVHPHRRPARDRRRARCRTGARRIRCTGCCRARSARARRSSHCARCCRSSTPAARPRCSRRPRCSPLSTRARSRRCSDRSPTAGRLGGDDGATRVALLTGSLPAAARKAALLDAAVGTAGIVVGTHALIQDQVSFAELGLVVVDEQHRFGVEQRDALRGKAERPPHLLVMTATPIPRTVAMTVFGDLDTSTLTELPLGRSPISTTVVPADREAGLARPHLAAHPRGGRGRPSGVRGLPAHRRRCRRVRGRAGRHPRSPTTCPPRRPPLAVSDVFAMLSEGPLAGLRLAQLHGRLHARREGPHDERLRRGPGRRAGRHHGHRGRRRRRRTPP